MGLIQTVERQYSQYNDSIVRSRQSHCSDSTVIATCNCFSYKNTSIEFDEAQTTVVQTCKTHKHDNKCHRVLPQAAFKYSDSQTAEVTPIFRTFTTFFIDTRAQRYPLLKSLFTYFLQYLVSIITSNILHINWRE